MIIHNSLEWNHRKIKPWVWKKHDWRWQIQLIIQIILKTHCPPKNFWHTKMKNSRIRSGIWFIWMYFLVWNSSLQSKQHMTFLRNTAVFSIVRHDLSAKWIQYIFGGYVSKLTKNREERQYMRSLKYKFQCTGVKSINNVNLKWTFKRMGRSDLIARPLFHNTKTWEIFHQNL